MFRVYSRWQRSINTLDKARIHHIKCVVRCYGLKMHYHRDISNMWTWHHYLISVIDPISMLEHARVIENIIKYKLLHQVTNYIILNGVNSGTHQYDGSYLLLRQVCLPLWQDILDIMAMIEGMILCMNPWEHLQGGWIGDPTKLTSNNRNLVYKSR